MRDVLYTDEKIKVTGIKLLHSLTFQFQILYC